jgi:hypothetical protein
LVIGGIDFNLIHNHPNKRALVVWPRTNAAFFRQHWRRGHGGGGTEYGPSAEPLAN